MIPKMYSDKPIDVSLKNNLNFNENPSELWLYRCINN